MSNDPWAAAQAVTGTTTAPATPNDASQVADSYAPQGSQLFNSGSVAPSLLNKTHGIGVERTGVIIKEPYDRQAVDYNTKEPKFWQTGEKKPVTKAVHPVTGQPNRPVMDTVLELETQYSMDAAEAAAVGRDSAYEGGQRVYVAGGEDLKKLREAIVDANKRGVVIRSGADMVGKRLTVKRTGQKPNPTGNPSWITEIRLDNA